MLESRKPMQIDLFATISLAVGLAGGILAVVGIILSVLTHRSTSALNAEMLATETRIAETTGVLKTLIDGLLASMTGHLTRQNEQMLLALTAASQSADRAADEAARKGQVGPGYVSELGRVKEQIEEVLTILAGPPTKRASVLAEIRSGPSSGGTEMAMVESRRGETPEPALQPEPSDEQS